MLGVFRFKILKFLPAALVLRPEELMPGVPIFEVLVLIILVLLHTLKALTIFLKI